MIGDRTEACLRSVEGLAQFALPTGIAIAAEGIEPSIFDDREAIGLGSSVQRRRQKALAGVR